MDILARHNVTVAGEGQRTIVFGHGLGSDQTIWDSVAPAFRGDSRVVLFDNLGAGGSDISSYDPIAYASLDRYAADLVAILEALGARDVLFVGHSIGGMIGMLAAILAPERFDKLALLCPSACFVNEPGYDGGFSAAEVDQMLMLIDESFARWSGDMASALMGTPDRPDLDRALSDLLCRNYPDIARQFARVVFLSDCRADLPRCSTPTLVMQTRSDIVAPETAGDYVAAHMPNATLHRMQATGHFPHMSAPDETIAALKRFFA